MRGSALLSFSDFTQVLELMLCNLMSTRYIICNPSQNISCTSKWQLWFLDSFSLSICRCSCQMICSRKVAADFRRSFLFEIIVSSINVCGNRNVILLLSMNKECNTERACLSNCLITFTCLGISNITWWKAQLWWEFCKVVSSKFFTH